MENIGRNMTRARSGFFPGLNRDMSEGKKFHPKQIALTSHRISSNKLRKL